MLAFFEEKATQGLEMIPSTILDIEQGLAGQICVQNGQLDGTNVV